jgi:hypothetical protein
VEYLKSVVIGFVKIMEIKKVVLDGKRLERN